MIVFFYGYPIHLLDTLGEEAYPQYQQIHGTRMNTGQHNVHIYETTDVCSYLDFVFVIKVYMHVLMYWLCVEHLVNEVNTITIVDKRGHGHWTMETSEVKTGMMINLIKGLG